MKNTILFLFIIFFPSQLICSDNLRTKATFAIITDFETGQVLYEKNADFPMRPASMAKMMTTYIAFQKIVDKEFDLDDKFFVSKKASKMGGSKSFFQEGDEVSIKDLLYAIIVQSGNDASVVLAEGISFTEENFVIEMNNIAKKLGMKNTFFTNSTGWPHPKIKTTARDLSILASALIRDFPKEKYPDLYPIFAVKSYKLKGILQYNRNPLLFGKHSKSNGVDGLKTGYTRESGYGLTASSVRGNHRIIMVLNGMQSQQERRTESQKIINLVYNNFKIYTFFDEGEIIENANVWLGKKSKVPLVLNRSFKKVLNREQRAKTKIKITWQDPIAAPIQKGQIVGKLLFNTIDKKEIVLPIYADESIEKLGFLDRIIESFKYLVFGNTYNTSLE